MATAILNANKRRKAWVNYLKLNTIGHTEMAENDAELLELRAQERGEFESEFEDESVAEETENQEDWELCMQAVNDENYKKERDMYEREMKMLAQREKVIERERKLLEMKEGLAQRHKQIRQMEVDLNKRTAILNRYEEKIIDNSAENWLEAKNKDIDEWVEKTGTVQVGQKGKQVQFDSTIGSGATMHINATGKQSNALNVPKPNYNRDELYENAMALTNDNDLITCRETGTFRLRGMGLAQEQITNKRGRRSEPLGEPHLCEGPKTMSKQSSTSRLMERIPATMMVNNPVIGKLDDGESLCSHDSKISIDVQKSDQPEDKRKLKSGMYAKVADDVVRQLKWPHKKLATRWVPNKLQMNQLTFEQVVAGELAIIQRSLDPEEVRSRIHILQKIAYWNMQGEGWPRVHEVYMSILHAIEEGEANFKSSFDEYDPMFPVKRYSSQHKKGANKRDSFWCRAYNRGQCSEDSPHKATVAGTERTVLHICASCWKQGRKEKHAETDPACPQKEL